MGCQYCGDGWKSICDECKEIEKMTPRLTCAESRMEGDFGVARIVYHLTGKAARDYVRQKFQEELDSLDEFINEGNAINKQLEGIVAETRKIADEVYVNDPRPKAIKDWLIGRK